MSQQKQVSSYFKTCKRVLPEQQAAKRRKVVLQSHEIEQLLDSEEEDSPSDSPPSVQHEKEEECEARVEDADDFADDEDWEDLANKTLDEIDEIVTSVTTSASDDHILSREDGDSVRSNAETVILSPQASCDSSEESKVNYESLIKTPKSSSLARGENLRLTKAEPPVRWTPPSTGQPLFTIGSRDQAKKRLDLTEKKKKRNVEFTKLSSLSMKKVVKSSNINYDALNIKLTPKLQYTPDPDPGMTSPVKTPKKKMPNLTAAITDAKKLEKKASPAQIKARLGKAKLKDLRSLLSGIEGSKLKAESVRKKVSVLQSPVKADILLELEVSSPPTTPVKLSRAPDRASPRKVPAFQRYHSLAQPVNRSLPLPLLYARLQEVFRSTDTVVSMMFNRQERISLDKLARHTTDLMNRKWDVKLLQQIICVFPQAYNIRWRSKLTSTQGMELVLEPNMSYKRDLKNLFDNEEPMARLMTGDLLVERRDMFRNSLLEIVKDHHEQFLASLDPPIDADRSKLTKWHKDFEVDLLPDIDLAELPADPHSVSQVPPKNNPTLFNLNPRLGEVLSFIDNGNDRQPEEKPLQSPSKMFSSPSKPRLEGLNPSLIAKVKAKEAARAKKEMMRTPEEIARISTLRKLPNLARLLRSLFAVEKKAALPVEFTCKKISESLGQVQDQKEVERQLRSLKEETDGWLMICKVGPREYFKTEKTDVNVICRKLQRRLDVALEN